MRADSSPHERHPSLWQQTFTAPVFPQLTGNMTADVCVVGAGIAGLSVACELALTGHRVVVLDRLAFGAGMTGRTTAHLASALDDRYTQIERLHGPEGARLAAASHTAAIARIAELVASEEIQCGFQRVDGWLFNPPGEDSAVLDDELAAAARAGLAVDLQPRAPIEHFDTGPAIRFARQAQFHPLHYLAGLADALHRHGGRVFTGTTVTNVRGGKEATVETENGAVVSAGAVVVATNVPVNDRWVIHTKQAPYTTYAIAFDLAPGTVEKHLLWDTGERAGHLDDTGPVPYHYVRVHSVHERDALIVGGRDHKTGQADDGEDRFGELERWARGRFPDAGAVTHRWSGQVMEPVDAMGFIGRNPADADNIYVITGDSGNGLSHGALAGLLISDLIGNRDNAWARLYDPGRVTLRAAGEFAHENLNVAAQMADHLTPGEVRHEDDVPTGCGAVVRHGLKKLAVFRDDDGTLHRLSAVCPHLKCIVHWNPAESTWDCPCHGSRFDATGRVLTGPAVTGLERVE